MSITLCWPCYGLIATVQIRSMAQQIRIRHCRAYVLPYNPRYIPLKVNATMSGNFSLHSHRRRSSPNFPKCMPPLHR